jgi:N-acetylneuraminic acid mutarotase
MCCKQYPEKYSIKMWQQDPASTNAPTERSSVTINSLNDKLYIFGGESSFRQPSGNEMFIYDINNKQWTVVKNETSPSPRLAHSSVILDNKIFVYGGRDSDGKDLDDLYIFDTDTLNWNLSNSSTNTPGLRSYHSAAAIESRNSFYVFAGCGTSGRLNSLYQFDANVDSWNEVNTSGDVPSVRGGPGFSSIGDNLLYVYAGFNGQEMNDLYFIDLRDGKWRNITDSATGEKPEPRSVHAMCSLGTDIFVFGGEGAPSQTGHEGAGSYLNDAYLFNTETNEWRSITAADSERPSKRGWLSCTNVGKDQVVLFGGFNGESRFNELNWFTRQ